MEYLVKEYKEFEVVAQLACFSPAEKVKEFQAMLHVSAHVFGFREQLQCLCRGVLSLLSEQLLCGAKPIFSRVFLSDAANQHTLTAEAMSDLLSCPISYIQQPPLDGSKMAVWILLQSDVNNVADGVEHNGYTQYFTVSDSSILEQTCNSYQQTHLLLENYAKKLKQYDSSIERNCFRTWFFARDIDCDYKDLVKARNENFRINGLTESTHYITSTGIQGVTSNQNIKVLLDAYAIKGIEDEQIQYLYARKFMNPTYNYGVAFERGVSLNFGDRRKVLISGTASIDNQGAILYEGDLKKQVLRMWLNVEALLSEAECDFSDLMQLIVYLRDYADYRCAKALFDEKFPNIPCVIVHAPVCRPGWLVEMECMAVKEIHNISFKDF